MDIKLRPVFEEDFAIAFKVKKQAMAEHIEAKWEWNEEFQLDLHATRWHEKPWYVIVADETDIGTISLHVIDDSTLRLGEFYLLESFRNNGVGSAVLNYVLDACDVKGQSVLLEALKWNPVRSLYERYGFCINSENEIHYFMGRKPKK